MGVVFIKRLFVSQVSARIAQLTDATSLIDLKLEFLCIVCSHEHYVTLNLPFSLVHTPSAPSSPCPSIASPTSQTSFTSSSTMIDKVSFAVLLH